MKTCIWKLPECRDLKREKSFKSWGGDKVIWGTDSPFCDYEWEFNKIRRYAENEKEFDKIMGGTIMSLLKE